MNEVNFLMSIGVTMVFSVLMMGVYRYCHDSLTYNRKFNVTLLMLAFISTVLLTLIQNNPLLSLGVLGSLSICRVRTNTKDSRDLGFVFWALSIGIASSVGAYFIGAAGSVILSIILIVFHKLTKSSVHQMMVVRGERPQLEPVQRLMHQTGRSFVQSKNVFSDSFELVYELQMKAGEEERILDMISHMEGIWGVNILAPETKVA